MRKLLTLLLILLPVTAAVLLLGGKQREYTTSSGEAYRLFKQAKLDIGAFRYAAADSLLEQALQKDRDFAAAHALLAGVLRQLGRPAAATAESTRAEELRARLGRPLERDLVELILLQGHPGHRARVDSLVDVILAADPENIAALTVRAQRLYARHDPGTEAAFRHILEIDPNYAPAYNLLGYLEASRGDYAKAIADLKTYAFLAPRQANPHDSLGEVLGWVGRYDEAEKELLTALQLQPDFAWAQLHLGALYMDRGEVRRGERILRELRSRVAGTPLAGELDQTVLGLLYSLELYGRAAAWTDSLAAGEDHSRGTYFRAVAAAARGDSVQARRILSRLTEHLPAEKGKTGVFREMMSRQLEAILAEARHDVPAARADWRRVLMLLPHAGPHEVWSIRWRLGRLALAAGEPDSALALADTILATNPRRLQALLLRAQAQAALADSTGARATLHTLAPLIAKADRDLPLVANYRRLARALAPPAAKRERPASTAESRAQTSSKK